MAILHKFKTSAEVEERLIGGKKSRSLQIDDSKPYSGVFVSGRALALTTSCSSTSPLPLCMSSLSFGSNSSSTSCADTDASFSSQTSWMSSGSKSHHRNSPVVVENPDEHEGNEAEGEKQQLHKNLTLAERLNRIIQRRSELPDTWYYSSNHVLVNNERSNRTIAALIRMPALDEIARIHAQQMAQEGHVHHLNLDTLMMSLDEGVYYYRRLGVNVQKGSSIRRIHEKMMQTSLSNKNNIIDRRFTHMGMGTAVDKDGVLYLCQIFRG
mmetsp:Transcript_9491/g.12565  ORF Transcript_9491/g.12565 Transcript_9491/m.12565 type:complete len:268 (-) Transcript_9491:186-989(-)|eukprot:CAMPEP_0198143992 /NCGR_PEP_ID=MMETSP1443-20131203/12347_1 /TAXON_ID=186043 /ORGANISM="Entomoneis sp., Strain CCMP2396" /LENGTH=267 /DNA_ID=CAMNT_0043807309 /DNA_START=22 /DNA_END=825 /DNA_ORIENTATION=+